MSPTTTLVIPILNEQESLRTRVLEILRFLQGSLMNGFPCQLLLADNGSTDSTQTIGEDLARSFPAVNFLRLEQKGVGLALKCAWGMADSDLVGYMDLDLATDLLHLPEALNLLSHDDVDMVVGSRLLPNSLVVGRRLRRELSSRAFNRIVRSVFGTTFTDGMCGFKFLKRKHLDALVSNGAQSDGWFFSTELLVIAEHLNLQVTEIPVRWTDDPNSKVRIMPLATEYLREIWALRKSLDSRQVREDESAC